MKKVFSWIIFAVYGIAIMIGISGNINGGAQIFVNWFGIPFAAAQVIYYVIAGIVVFIGMKAVGIAPEVCSNSSYGNCCSYDCGYIYASA